MANMQNKIDAQTDKENRKDLKESLEKAELEAAAEQSEAALGTEELE